MISTEINPLTITTFALNQRTRCVQHFTYFTTYNTTASVPRGFDECNKLLFYSTFLTFYEIFTILTFALW